MTSRKYSVRLARDEEYEMISQIVKDSKDWREERNLLLEVYGSGAAIQSRVSQGLETVYVREGDQGIVGFAAVVFSPKVLHLAAVSVLYVMPNYRRQGHACAILQHIAKEAMASGTIKLTATLHHQNLGSQFAFMRAGYIQEGRIIHGYAPGAHSIMMGLSLTSNDGGDTL